MQNHVHTYYAYRSGPEQIYNTGAFGKFETIDSSGVAGTGVRTGTTTRGKRKGVKYIIKVL